MFRKNLVNMFRNQNQGSFSVSVFFSNDEFVKIQLGG